ncbi:MAG: hypothetical protein LBH82_00550 [Bacteroidales bacterium]|nr:hypothetical protein [Bacteroidales bacterium]
METDTIQKNGVSPKTFKSRGNLKSIFATLFCLFCIVNVSFAEKVVGTYSLSYFNKQYDIEASEIKNGKFSVYIQVSAERDFTRAMIEVKSSDLEEFTQFLTQMKDKYVEWANVAKENNVTDMSKDMDFKSPSTTICWSSSKWFFSFGHKLQPRFLILDSGKMVVTIHKKVTASSNQYIDEKIYWVFSDATEIDELISQLNAEKIISKLQEKENASDLFK